MVNHPNRGRKYTVIIQHFSNSGLGWERMPDDMGGVERMDMTRAQVDELAEARTAESTEVSVHDNYGERLAMANRGNTSLVWY
jgi:hypothetical protein